MIGILGYYCIGWLIYLVPILLIACPIWYWGRNRTDWKRSDFAVAVYPYWIWVGLMIFVARGKTLSNFFVEPIWLGLIAVVSPATRLITGKRIQSKRYPELLLLFVILMGIMFWKWMPSLPE